MSESKGIKISQLPPLNGITDNNSKIPISDQNGTHGLSWEVLDNQIDKAIQGALNQPTATSLTTNAKTIIGSINELKANIKDLPITSIQQNIKANKSNIQTNSKNIEEIKAAQTAALKSAPVNLVNLGADPTGEKDVGALINQYTATHDLYLPSGKYKVTTPIVLKKSLFGDGYSRVAGTAGTCLVSGLTEGSVIEVTSSGYINIIGISIRLTGDEAGILSRRTSGWTCLYLGQIGISNLGNNAGIDIQTNSISREVYADNITVMGKNDCASTGLRLAGTTDSRFNGIEIMSCQVGIDLKAGSGILTLSNVHIWTSYTNNTVKKVEWWKNTVGIRLAGNNQVIGSNVYLDTCRYGVYCIKGNNNVSINGLGVWYDDSYGGKGAQPSNIGAFFYTPVDSENNRLTINGGFYKHDPAIGYFCSNSKIKVSVNNLMCSFYQTGFDKNNYHCLPSYGMCVSKDYQIQVPSNFTKTAICVGELYLSDNSVGAFQLTNTDGASCILTVSSKYVRQKDVQGSINIYYVKTENSYKIYAPKANYTLRFLYGDPDFYLINTTFICTQSGALWAEGLAQNELNACMRPIKYTTNQNYITCWGDSLTDYGGWTTRLGELSGLQVINMGQGSDTSWAITARQGGDAIVVNNITIPADTTSVSLGSWNQGGLSTVKGNKITTLLYGDRNFNPCKLAGILGNVNYSGSGTDVAGEWSFTRLVKGTAITINRPTTLQTYGDWNYNHPYLMIIFAGTNDANTQKSGSNYGFNIANLITRINLMIQHANAEHVLVLGLTIGTTSSQANYEKEMGVQFGRNFINLRQYLTTPVYTNGKITTCYGLQDAEITPDNQSLTEIANGSLPHQLRIDSVHWTEACRKIVGDYIFKQCQELGIF